MHFTSDQLDPTRDIGIIVSLFYGSQQLLRSSSIIWKQRKDETEDTIEVVATPPAAPQASAL
jgi:hypothetical protein